MLVIAVNNFNSGTTTFEELLAQFHQPMPICLTFFDPFAVDAECAMGAKNPTARKF